jgi:hypothetical protein
MDNNNKNIFLNIGYLVGLFYTSFLFGFLLTINIPWILLCTIANSSDMNHTINLFCAPVLENISDLIKNYSYKLNINDHIHSIIETSEGGSYDEETSDEEVEHKSSHEDTSDEEMDNVITETKTVPKEDDVKCNLPESPKDNCTIGSYFDMENCAKENCAKENCAKEGCPKEGCSKEGCSKEDCPKEDCPKEDCPKEDCPKEDCVGEESCSCMNDNDQKKDN